MFAPILPTIVEAPPEGGAGSRNYNDNYVFFWNEVGLDLNRLSHSVGGFQTGPPMSARALAILHLAMHDAYFGAFPYAGRSDAKSVFKNDFKPYLTQAFVQSKWTSGSPGDAASARDAVAGAAITVLNKLYKSPDKRDAGVSNRAATALRDFVDTSIRSYQEFFRSNFRSAAYQFGVDIATEILRLFEVRSNEPGPDAGGYGPNSDLPYYFSDEPSHPVRPQPIDVNNPSGGTRATRPYHAPLYGRTASVIATTDNIMIAKPPLVPSQAPDPETNPSTRSQDFKLYLDAVEDVHRMGGVDELRTTKRRPAQTAAGIFWAYDGSNLIGTPPRLYNQIAKQIAFDHRDKSGALSSDTNNAEFVRLLALVNVAMADAGTFCWRDKYTYELWRPLSGVRQDPTGCVPDGHGRPFWKTLGAPSTNTNDFGFKPPFPAYPSGHATFGAAAFQMVRLFYDQRGDLSLKQIWEKKNGAPPPQGQQPVAPDPSKKYRNVADDGLSFTFISDELNGISRIWIGVHWNFDAFAGDTVGVRFDPGNGAGRDTSQPAPRGFKQQLQVEADGSTKYQKVADMDWFRADGEGRFVGGVPLGMQIANSIFDNRMRSTGSLTDLGANVGQKRA